MKTILSLIIGLVLIAGAAFAVFQFSYKSYSWRYKITVTVETPEGEVSGSAVREMSNSKPIIDLPDVGNPANMRGEAVVVDLGERGVLFALIGDGSDLEFYGTFPTPNDGGSTPEGIKYYALLPVGTKADLGTDRYIKLVTFTDMDDPKSVALVYGKGVCAWAKEPPAECEGVMKSGTYTAVNRFEELFGEGVRLKGITLEITDEPVTWGVVDEWLPKTFKTEIKDNWRNLPRELRHKLYYLTRFKQGI